MKFLFMPTQIEEAWAKAPPGEAERVYQQYMTLERDLADGKRELVGEPYTNTEEVMGGYYVLECASLHEALEWAKRMPNYGHGSIEVRPFWE